jgi:hypothetical protein
MDPHMKLGIYVEFQSLSILKYLEPLMGDFFMTRFADCIFNEYHFPALMWDNKFIDDGWKLFGMIKPSYPLTHIQRRLIFKFKKS